MSFVSEFEAAPDFIPMLNIGAGFDIITGKYYKGKHGENILSGGLAPMTGIAGGGNKFKSTIMWYMMLSVLNRYKVAEGLAYDTEISLSMGRLYQLAQYMDAIGGVDLAGENRLRLTNGVKYSGNKFFEVWSKIARHRAENPKEFMLDSPFMESDGKFMRLFKPSVTGIDSLSNFTADAVSKMQKENELGDSGRNMEAMRSSLIKTQMLMELPNLTGSSGCYMMMSAHVGNHHQLDPYAPNAKRMQHLKQNLKFKNVPEKFEFLPNNCWHAENATVMERDKLPEFPRSPDDDLKGDTDLNLVSLRNLRGKNGMTGLPLEIVVSQTDGVLPELTALKALKTAKFGLGGNDRNYFLDLLPEESLSRTTVRAKSRLLPKLQRAFEISHELSQINDYWHDFDKSLFMAPDELYAKIKEKGYNWDELLDTRGFWVFNQDAPNHKPFLSTKDLLEMATGQYRPYWLKK